ncbi:LON peptidase substrate-binding domain-containing protein, partial [Chloroflexota bacterium]
MSETDWNAELEDLDSEEMHNRAEALENIPNLVPDENGIIVCPVLPLRDVIVFPHMVAPLPVGRRSTLKAIREANNQNQIMLAILQRDPSRQNLRPQDFLPIGVAVAVSELLTGSEEEAVILVQGRFRVKIVDFNTEGSVLYARGLVLEEHAAEDTGQDALMRHLMRTFERFAVLQENLPDEALMYLLGIDEPGWLADMVASSFSVHLRDRQQVLTTLDVKSRLEYVIKLLEREIDMIEIEEELDAKVQNEVDRGQRENYLRERMRVIQRELGEEDPWIRELRELQDRVRDAKLPDEVEATAVKEIGRLYQMPPMSPEVGVIRTYIDWILDLPWHEETEDNLDVNHAAEVLDSQHFGLEKAKDRIIEYIAVKSLQPKKSRQPILCFIGPPGTGKTSLGRSIAEALDRKFVRLSLGGVRDEAEMRGHRRTYIGALPGRILQTLKRAGMVNPLFMLDEVDKLGIGFRGDPAAALLEVLDPEQNHAFSDHYLELPYDLSKVMFITTANDREDIPWALLDRMEVIEFPGYIEEEKLEIAKRFLIARQQEQAGLEDEHISFTEDALKSIIRQ